MRRTLASLLAVSVVGVGAGVGTVAVASDSPEPSATMARKAKTIASGRASGDYAIAQATGEAKSPRTIKLRVTATPSQRVSVAWTMVCVEGMGAGSKSGQFEATAPLTRALRKPSSRPDSCTVSANAQLSESGKVVVRITA